MGLDEAMLNQLVCVLFSEWQSFQIILRTLRTQSYKNNIICRPDESTLYGSYEEVTRFITSSTELLHPKQVVELVDAQIKKY